MLQGRYQRKRKLGSGGMGVVYLAIDRLTGMELALKQITFSSQFTHDATQERVDDFKLTLTKEFQTLATLRHPNVITVLDYGFDEQGAPFFTMPYLAEAHALLEAGVWLGREELLRLLQQLTQALVYIHRQGIVHRDLKPNNVLVVDGVVKILDFGLASRIHEQSTYFTGSLGYSAPELMANAEGGAAADMFAIGVMAFQLFARGQSHPFDLPEGFVATNVLDKSPNWGCLPDDPVLNELIAPLLAKEPGLRPSAAQFLVQLNDLLGKEVRETVAIRESYLQAAAFVGRTEEMAQLRQLLAETKQGVGRSILIGGESGVGKSRLVNELRVQALVDGFVVLQGQCVREARHAYQPWLEPIRLLCLLGALPPPLAIGVLQSLIPDLPALLGVAEVAAPMLAGTQAQQRLFTVITALFQQQKRPLLLILEDLQWAEESLDLLQWVLRHFGEADSVPLLIVGTYRVEERPSLAKQFPNMVPMLLPRLTDEGVYALCENMLGKGNMTPTLVDFLQTQSEGNTFFLVEVVRALAEQGGGLDMIGRMSLPKALFPEGIVTIVKQRLALLPDEIKPWLYVAAVAGRQLDLRLMQALVGETAVWEEVWLPMLLEVGFLSVDGVQWRFAHDKLREGVIHQLDEMRVRGIHQQVAVGLESVYENDWGYAADLMWHWGAAGYSEKEAFYAQKAGYYAQSQNAYQDALYYWGRAEVLVPPAYVERRFEIYMAQEEIYGRLGDRQAQSSRLALLQVVTASLDVAKQEAVLLRQAEYAFVISEYEQAIAYSRQLIEAGQMRDNLGLVINGHQLWGVVLHHMGRYDVAQEHFARGLALAEGANSESQMADCLNGLGKVLLYQGSYDAAQVYLERALALWQALDDQLGAGQSLNNLGIVAYYQGFFDEAKAYYVRSLAIRRAIGERRGEAQTLNNLGIIAYYQGAYNVAQDYYMETLTIGKDVGDRRGQASTLNNLGGVAIQQVDYEKARQYYQGSLTIVQEIGDRASIAITSHNLGIAAIKQGRLAVAKGYLMKSLTIRQEIGDRHGLGQTYHNLGYVFWLQNEVALAKDAYQQALSIRQALNQAQYLVEDWAGMAQVALAGGEIERADHYAVEVLGYLLENPRMVGAQDQIRTFYMTWAVLQQLEQPANAKRVLSLAIEVMEDYLVKNPTLRSIYLQQRYQNELWQAWQRLV